MEVTEPIPKAAQGSVLSNPNMEYQRPLGKLLEASISLTVEKKGRFLIFPAFHFVSIMGIMEKKTNLKNEDNWYRNYRDRKLDHHSILEFLFPTFYSF